MSSPAPTCWRWAAAALLLEEIQEPATHRHRSVLLEPFIVARESSVGR